MGLTRIRAEQISDIDYKQSVRVLTTTNVTLGGGAPSTVDGVSLVAGDRILVTGQTTTSQNGLYDVATVGSGSNGTWVRTSDANQTGEINAGMIVMVTEGTEWGDTSWKLITDDPIVIGITGLTFLQNTGNSFSIINVVGSGNVVANGVSSTVSFGSDNNISITGNATADIITFNLSNNVSITGNIQAGNLSAAGNVNAQYYFGDGTYLTGIVPVIQSYLFTNDLSNVSPYYQAVPIDTYVAGNVVSATTTVSTTATLIGEFLTNAGFPNTTSIPAGQLYSRYETQKTSGGNRSYTTYFTVSKRDISGTETLLLTSDLTTATQVTTVVQQTVTAINASSITLLTTDRLAIKIYAYTSSGTDSIRLFWDANTDSGFDLSLSPPSIATFVPYQNATANVQLGAYGLTANYISTSGTVINSNISTTGNITGNSVFATNIISAAGNIFGGGIRSTSSPTPPSNPSVGDFWYDTSTNAQYRYTFDGTDYFWLDDYGSTLGINGSFSAVTNGTSNITIANTNSNAAVSINGTSNVAVFANTGFYTSALNVTTSFTPASSSATGVAGQIAWDSNYVYVCIATNTWKRSPIGTW